MKRILMTAALAAVAALAFAPSANAAFGDFTYTTSITAPASSPVNGTPNGIATLGFTPRSSPTTLSAAGLGTDITPVRLTLTGTSAGTATFSIPVDFTVTITDVASGKTDTVEFKGTLSGPVTVGPGASSNIALTGSMIIQGVNNTGVNYMVTGPNYLPVGPVAVGGTSTGGIGLHVRAIPEPASMALLSMGAVGALGMIRRRRTAV